MTPPLFENVRAVLFDLDGTLYSQHRLRLRIGLEILAYYFLRPTRLYELQVLRTFRSERERHAGVHSQNLLLDQYDWVAIRLNVSSDLVQRVVERWIYRAPLKYVYSCKPGSLDQCLSTLRAHGIAIGVCSDYPTDVKLHALGIVADATASATDESVRALKPDPTSFLRVAKVLGVPPSECLVVGDRPELDGVAAQRAGMRFVHATASDAFYTMLEQDFKRTSTGHT